MKPHVLIALNILQERHLQRIAQALEGWATWESIAEQTPASVYAEKVQIAEVVVGWPQAEWLLTSSVRFLQIPSAGYDPFVKKGLDDKENFVASNARGVYSLPVAEHCIALMMALTRRLPRHVVDQGKRVWSLRHPYHIVAGTAACIVGLGDIGTELARLCTGLGMSVTGVRRNAQPQAQIKTVYPLTQLKQAVSEANHVFSILPGGTDTRHLFDGAIFDAMRKGAFFYNVGRGSTVDEQALIGHLRSGHLAGAGLDVFEEEPLSAESPLWELENVLLTPHAAGRYVEETDVMCDLIIKNLTAYRHQKLLTNVVIGS